MARVSVVIPCYNDGQYLRQSVVSALSQSFEDLDVIVVDDGSTDGHTLSELESLAQQPRVTVTRQSNAGPSAARNKGVSACSGEYFLPLDADDLIDTEYVAKAVEVLDADDRVGAVYCRADLIGDRQGEWRLPEFEWATMLVHNVIFNACLFRTRDWKLVGGYDESLRTGREDHDFILKVLALGRTVEKLDGKYFHYRQHDGSRNAAIGQDRDKLVAVSAQIFRNNLHLYAEKSEDLFDFIYRQHDQITDLRHRYAVLEHLRERHTGAVNVLKHARRAIQWTLGRR